MAANSAIEWTGSTWNPVTGCTRVSPGCRHCYAERIARRLKAAGHRHYARGFEVAMHEDALGLPLGWKRPRLVFVNSMSDLFHPAVPEEFILRVFQAMAKADQHIYQVLTKRSERLSGMTSRLPWAPNTWMGVTVESADYLGRMDDLRRSGAHTKFISLEPLLAPVPRLDLAGIDWVIVGGESGPGARPMQADWVRDIREQCLRARVPFFFKQWGGVRRKQAGRVLDGRTWDQMPPLPGHLAAANAASV